MKPTESAATALLTVEEYLALPDEPGYRSELVRGRVVREPRPAPLHGLLQARIAHRLVAYEEARGGRGAVLAESGFLLAADPPTLRGPDFAYVAAERIPAGGYDQSVWRFAPDLAVEVISPSNRWTEIQEKVSDYLAAGTRLVWVVDAIARTVTVYRQGGEARRLAEGDELSGADVLPGLRIPLAELFHR